VIGSSGRRIAGRFLADDRLAPDDLRDVSEVTLGHYERGAEQFWEGTRDHDVAQNVEALLRHLEGAGPFAILDFGCGPGRDLVTFRRLGHDAVGLDGAPSFVAMARAHSGAEVWLQDFLSLDLPPARFDGIFANASLFHVPGQELPRVLGELRAALRPRGVLFASNPHGRNDEGWQGERYGAWHTPESWRRLVESAGFELVREYFRPMGRPRAEQPWHATVWRRHGS
jgi:SAM-dependent methyltransferase